jgi:hypothetical protein
MKAVVVAAAILATFAWLSQESPSAFQVTILTVGLLLLIVASPFLLAWLGIDEMVGPRIGLASAGSPPARPRPTRRQSRKW